MAGVFVVFAPASTSQMIAHRILVCTHRFANDHHQTGCGSCGVVAIYLTLARGAATRGASTKNKTAHSCNTVHEPTH